MFFLIFFLISCSKLQLGYLKKSVPHTEIIESLANGNKEGAIKYFTDISKGDYIENFIGTGGECFLTYAIKEWTGSSEDLIDIADSFMGGCTGEIFRFDKNNMSPLHHSLEKGYYDFTKHMLEVLNSNIWNSSVARVSLVSGSPLCLCIEKNYIELFKYLVGYLVNHSEERVLSYVCDKEGNSPLMIAVAYGRYELVEYILNNSCVNIEHLNIHSKNVLIIAIENLDFKMVELLMKKGVDSNIIAGSISPILLAASKKDKKITELLLASLAEYASPLRETVQAVLKVVADSLVNQASGLLDDFVMLQGSPFKLEVANAINSVRSSLSRPCVLTKVEKVIAAHFIKDIEKEYEWILLRKNDDEIGIKLVRHALSDLISDCKKYIEKLSVLSKNDHLDDHQKHTLGVLSNNFNYFRSQIKNVIGNCFSIREENKWKSIFNLISIKNDKINEENKIKDNLNECKEIIENIIKTKRDSEYTIREYCEGDYQ